MANNALAGHAAASSVSTIACQTPARPTVPSGIAIRFNTLVPPLGGAGTTGLTGAVGPEGCVVIVPPHRVGRTSQSRDCPHVCDSSGTLSRPDVKGRRVDPSRAQIAESRARPEHF